MKVGFTGTSTGMNSKQKISLYKTLIELGATEFHHGDCIGADAEAHEIAKSLGCVIHIHPPINHKARAFKEGNYIHDEKPYLVRNHDIVTCTNILVATPRSRVEELRSGTWATIRYANKSKKKVVILYPFSNHSKD